MLLVNTCISLFKHPEHCGESPITHPTTTDDDNARGTLKLTTSSAVRHGIKVLEQDSFVGLHSVEEIPPLLRVVLDLKVLPYVMREDKVVGHEVLALNGASVTDAQQRVVQRAVEGPPETGRGSSKDV